MSNQTQTHVYKARDKKTGLFFTGGAYGMFTSTVGAAFSTPGACKVSLRHFARFQWRPNGQTPSVEIVEFALTESRVVGDYPL